MNLGFLRLLIYIYMIIYEYIVLLSSLNFCSVPLVLSNNAIYTEAACAEAEGACYGSFDHPTLTGTGFTWDTASANIFLRGTGMHCNFVL